MKLCEIWVREGRGYTHGNACSSHYSYLHVWTARYDVSDFSRLRPRFVRTAQAAGQHPCVATPNRWAMGSLGTSGNQTLRIQQV